MGEFGGAEDNGTREFSHRAPPVAAVLMKFGNPFGRSGRIDSSRGMKFVEHAHRIGRAGGPFGFGPLERKAHDLGLGQFPSVRQSFKTADSLSVQAQGDFAKHGVSFGRDFHPRRSRNQAGCAASRFRSENLTQRTSATVSMSLMATYR